MTGPVIVVGARPNFMKIAPIYNELKTEVLTKFYTYRTAL